MGKSDWCPTLSPHKIYSKWNWDKFLKAQPEMTISSVQIVYLGMWFQGARRKDIGNETEKKAMPVQRCIIEVFQSSGQPLFYFAGISEEPEICFRTEYTRDKPGGISHWLLYHVLRVPCTPMPCIVPSSSQWSHTTESEKPTAEAKRCMHRSTVKVAIRLTLHQAGRNMHRTGQSKQRLE